MQLVQGAARLSPARRVQAVCTAAQGLLEQLARSMLGQAARPLPCPAPAAQQASLLGPACSCWAGSTLFAWWAPLLFPEHPRMLPKCPGSAGRCLGAPTSYTLPPLSDSSLATSRNSPRTASWSRGHGRGPASVGKARPSLCCAAQPLAATCWHVTNPPRAGFAHRQADIGSLLPNNWPGPAWARSGTGPRQRTGGHRQRLPMASPPARRPCHRGAEPHLERRALEAIQCVHVHALRQKPLGDLVGALAGCQVPAGAAAWAQGPGAGWRVGARTAWVFQGWAARRA